MAIRYHNLREEELGALLSAITFHNTEGLFHSIGMAKPLGYGKITLNIDNLDESKKNKYLKAFETFMDCELNNSTPLWFQSVQVKELFGIAKGSSNAEVDSKLKYMDLETFVDAKGRKKDNPKHALQRFSFISKNIVDVKSLINATDISVAKAKYEKEKVLNRQDNDALKQYTKSHFEELLKTKLENKKAELLAVLESKRQAQKDFEEKQAEEERQKKKQDLNTEGVQTGLVFTNYEYETIAEIVKKHLNKYRITELTSSQKEQLTEALTKSYNLTKQNKKSVWAKKDNKFTEFPWSDIKKWLGDEQAKALNSLMN
jgi:hypothetical protein